jgi:hypothetical protein
VQVDLPYGASARKPVLRCSTRKVNNNYLMLLLALICEPEPDKAFKSIMGVYFATNSLCQKVASELILRLKNQKCASQKPAHSYLIYFLITDSIIYLYQYVIRLKTLLEGYLHYPLFSCAFYPLFVSSVVFSYG